MPEISIKDTIEKVIKQLGADIAQVPFAVSKAMNRAMFETRTTMQSVMRQRLHNPTTYTVNSLRVVTSNKKNLVAKLDYKNAPSGKLPAEKWMYQQVEGGGIARHHKAFERKMAAMGLIPQGAFVTPTDHAALDNNGNWKLSQIRQIVLEFGKALDKVAQKRLDKSAAKKSGRTRAQRYFIVGFDDPRMAAGIYQNVKGRDVKCLALLAKRAPIYRRAFPFYEIAGRTVVKKFDDFFPQELKKAMETSK